MSTTTTIAQPITVISADRRPIERAWIGELIDPTDPYQFLQVTFPTPGGGLRWYYAWTPGGDRLGDDIDTQAIGHGYDAGDWMELTRTYETLTSRGNAEIRAVDLRPLADDIRLGYTRCDDSFRDKLRAFSRGMAEGFPDRYRPLGDGEQLPRWWGVGPHLVGRHSR